jgi:thiosulfate dehydrogenase
MRRSRCLLMILVLAGCGETRNGIEYGHDVFHSPSALSRSGLNTFSCATCHADTDPPADDRLLPGASLVGVVARERFWGGQVLGLEDAVNVCVVDFLRGQPLDPDSDQARALYEYLVSITPDDSPSTIVPMTVVENITAITLPGDVGRGSALYRRACGNCHGAIHTGAGQILRPEVLLPEVANDYVTLFPGTPPGLVFTEVIRHGRYFNIGGAMPFYTVERLSDQDVADILAYLELPSISSN